MQEFEWIGQKFLWVCRTYSLDILYFKVSIKTNQDIYRGMCVYKFIVRSQKCIHELIIVAPCGERTRYVSDGKS